MPSGEPINEDDAGPATHVGLPVKGYQPQTSSAVDAVNAFKRLEEQILQTLDGLAVDEKLAADKRWLAIGRTQIEQAFMAINRSVFKPSRVEL